MIACLFYIFTIAELAGTGHNDREAGMTPWVSLFLTLLLSACPLRPLICFCFSSASLQSTEWTERAQCVAYRVVPKGLLTLLGFFYAMRSLVPVGHFRNISGHLFTWLVWGSFQWRHGLLFTDCIVWDDQDKVMFLKDHIGSTEDDGVPGLQSFNCFNYHSIHTSTTVDWYLLQLTFHEIWQ